MKKLFFLLLALIGGLWSEAQNINPEVDYLPGRNAAPILLLPPNDFWSKFCIDLNLMTGILSEKVNAADPTVAYPNALNTKVSGLKYNNGLSKSIDAELSYYFDHAGRYGIGVGLMYMQQNGNLTMDNFHIEYKSTDAFNNTFRQVLTSDGQIKETIRTSNFSIPVLLKYKKRFSGLIGFAADAGVLLNIADRSHYSTNASFDYEAVYQYTGVPGDITPLYDYLATPAAGDLLITKSQYLSSHSAASIDQYFNTLRSEGYNVGLGVKPAATTGHVTDVSASVGVLLRPAVSFFFGENVILNCGFYYLYQDFKHNAPAGYQLTNKLGQYDPLLNSVTGAANNSYGISVGVTYRFCKAHPALGIPVEDTSSVMPEDNEQDLRQGSGSFLPQALPGSVPGSPLNKEGNNENNLLFAAPYLASADIEK